MNLVGHVLDSGDAIVNLTLRGPRGAMLSIQTVIDTGFNGSLVIPADQIAQLGLRVRDRVCYTLADGSEVISTLYLAEVEWFGDWRRVLVAAMEGGALLGMSLLHGCHLGIDVVNGGQAVIAPLPSA